MLRPTRTQTSLVTVGSLLAIATFACIALLSATAPTTMTFTDLESQLRAGEVTALAIDGEHVTATSAAGEAKVVVSSEAAREALVTLAREQEAEVSYAASTLSRPARAGLTGGLLTLALIAGIALVRRHRSSKHSFFERHEPTPEGTRFDDIAGLEEAKEALLETVAYLQHPDRFRALGARHPRGILLTGQPGTGKTMLARAVANEAGVSFLSCSGSSFQEMFVGVGARRIRQLFEEARATAPCIVFIDEIDALGRSRGPAGDGASGEHDRTLNQLLVAMDGFERSDNVVVIATTNRPDILDAALVRPGRFDRHIVAALPCQAERHAILDVVAREVPLAANVDLETVAHQMVGASGADLKNLVNEAALLAARHGADAVGADHLAEAREKILLGDRRPALRMSDRDRHATAIHEAGHTVVALTAPECDDVEKVSILPRGKALGVTQTIPKERVMCRREYLEDQVCMLLGGRAAELELLSTATAGARDDLRRASELARQMVAELGMGTSGCLHVALDGGQPVPAAIDEEASRLLEAQLARARRIVLARRDEIAHLVERLLDRDVVGEDELRTIMPRRDESVATIREANETMAIPA